MLLPRQILKTRTRKIALALGILLVGLLVVLSAEAPRFVYPPKEGEPVAAVKLPTPTTDRGRWLETHCPGQARLVRKDGSHVDCLYVSTKGTALVAEVEFPENWGECVVQTRRNKQRMPNAKVQCWLICGKDGAECAESAKNAYYMQGSSSSSPRSSAKIQMEPKEKQGELFPFIKCFSWHTGKAVDCEDN